MAMKKRLFIAIDLPGKIKERIVRLQNNLKTEAPRATWVKPENLHLTLIFLGNTDYSQIPEIISTLSQLKDDAFEITFWDIGGFPNQNRAEIIFLGIKENLALNYLQGKIRERLEKLNLRIDDKKFVPHLTLARLKRPKKMMRIKFDTNIGNFPAKEFILYESELYQEGPKHTLMKKFSLI